MVRDRKAYGNDWVLQNDEIQFCLAQWRTERIDYTLEQKGQEKYQSQRRQWWTERQAEHILHAQKCGHKEDEEI